MSENSTSKITTESLEKYNRYLFQNYLIFPAIVLIFYILMGLIGNGLVIYIHKFQFQKNISDRYFIPYLAMVDGTSCIINASANLAFDILPVNYRNDIVCAYTWFIGLFFTSCSVFILVIIALQRYLKICRPHGYQMTLRSKRMSLLLVAFISLLISWPSLLFYGSDPILFVTDKGDNMTGYMCTVIAGPLGEVPPLTHKLLLLILTVCAFVALTIMYVFIGKEMYKHHQRSKQKKNKSFRTTQQNSLSQTNATIFYLIGNSVEVSEGTSTSTNTKSTDENTEQKKHKSGDGREFRFTIMFMLINLIFVIAFVPKLSLILYDTIKINFWLTLSPSEMTWYRILYEMYIVNNIVNPFIYGFFDKRFRDEFRNIFCRSTKK